VERENRVRFRRARRKEGPQRIQKERKNGTREEPNEFKEENPSRTLMIKSLPDCLSREKKKPPPSRKQAKVEWQSKNLARSGEGSGGEGDGNPSVDKSKTKEDGISGKDKRGRVWGSREDALP